MHLHTFDRECAEVETEAHVRVCGEQKEVIINYKRGDIGGHLWKRDSGEHNCQIFWHQHNIIYILVTYQ